MLAERLENPYAEVCSYFEAIIETYDIIEELYNRDLEQAVDKRGPFDEPLNELAKAELTNKEYLTQVGVSTHDRGFGTYPARCFR